MAAGAAATLGASTGATSQKAGVNAAGAAASGSGFAGRGFKVGAGPTSYFDLFFEVWMRIREENWIKTGC